MGGPGSGRKKGSGKGKRIQRTFLVEAVGKQTGPQSLSITGTSLSNAKKQLKQAGFKVNRIRESAATKP